MVQADLARDRERRTRIVPGDHDRADPSAAALGDRVGHAGPHRVVETGQPEEPELVIMLGIGKQVVGSELRTPHRQHPLAGSCGLLNLRGQPVSCCGLKWHRSAIASGAPLAAMT